MVYLSICIPTFNRKGYLRETVESLVSQDAFIRGEVDIVVSDNASSDGTEEMMRGYVAATPGVRYFRNGTNEGVNVNIFKCLSLGIGIYRKLSNDTFVFKEGALAQMVECVKRHESERPFMVFVSEAEARTTMIRVNDLDHFVRVVSYHITHDALIGFWDGEWPSVVGEDVSVWFWVTHGIFRIVNEKKNAVIYTMNLFDVTQVNKKDISYGLIDVFCTYYFRCYEPYIGKEIKKISYRKVRRELLYQFFHHFFLVKEIYDDYKYSKDDNLANLRKAYGSPLVWFTVRLAIEIAIRKAVKRIKVRLLR